MVETFHRATCERCGIKIEWTDSAVDQERRRWGLIHGKDVCPTCVKVWENMERDFWEEPEKTPSKTNYDPGPIDDWIRADFMMPNPVKKIWTRKADGTVSFIDFNIIDVTDVKSYFKALGITEWKRMK